MALPQGIYPRIQNLEMRITYKTEGVEFNESEQKGTQSVLIFLIRYLKARNI